VKALVNGIELAYDDSGAGLPVLFLHAFPLHRAMWEYQVNTLLSEQRFRLVTLDWRGFGESEIIAGVSTMEGFADDVVALMDTLGMQQAVFCGLSMGGYVAFALLRKYAERVKALVLADTKPEADSEEAKANREQVAKLALEVGTDAIADLQVPRLLAASTREQQPEVEVSVRRMIGGATPQGIAAAARGMALRADATDLLAHITCPTLVLVGEQDAVTPPTLAQQYAAQITGVRFAVIPQAGHLSNLEQPRVFTDLLRQFLLLCQ
jgi:3-oxoadipate enol-lactonase